MILIINLGVEHTCMMLCGKPALSEEKELLALVLRLETWAADARSHGGFVMEQEAFSSIEVLVQRQGDST